jgi:hypothetical protein
MVLIFIFLKEPDWSLILKSAPSSLDNTVLFKKILFPDKYKSFHFLDGEPKL